MSAAGAIRSSHSAAVLLRVYRLCEVSPVFSKCCPASKKRVTPAIHSVFELHVFLHVEENERAEFFPLASTGGVAAELVRIVRPRFVLLANLLAFLVFPVLPAGEVAHIKRL